ncbi:MAG: hypothetical protein U0X91_01510 [Spirosomataceae bacterium]
MPRILLDENIPKRLKFRLLDAAVSMSTVRDMDWLSVKNGKLLRMAVENGFDVFITTDKNIPYQQNISQLDLAILVLNVPNLKYEFLQPLLPQIVALVPNTEKGKFYFLQL